MKVYCGNCKRETNHEILKELREKFSNEDFWGDDTWQIIRCKGCDATSFRHEWLFSEDYGPDGELLVQEELFPRRSKDTLDVKTFHNMPHKIRWIYREVIDSFNNGLFTLCAGGVRAIIEGICNFKKIHDGPVEVTKKDGTKTIQRRKDFRGKIAGMVEKGLITNHEAEILHDLRFLGNVALHELEQPTSEEIKCAIEILEHTLYSQYEMTKKARVLKEFKEEKEKAREKTKKE